MKIQPIHSRWEVVSFNNANEWDSISVVHVKKHGTDNKIHSLGFADLDSALSHVERFARDGDTITINVEGTIRK